MVRKVRARQRSSQRACGRDVAERSRRTGSIVKIPALSGGGLTNAQKRVLSDLQARALAKTAIRIRGIFGKKEQDIEWGILNGQIYIVQARPYIDKN